MGKLRGDIRRGMQRGDPSIEALPRGSEATTSDRTRLRRLGDDRFDKVTACYFREYGAEGCNLCPPSAQ